MKQKIKKNSSKALKKLDMLCEYTTSVQKDLLSMDSNDTVLDIVRKNAYHALIIDEISFQIESWLDKLTVDKLKFIFSHNIIQKAYNRVEKADGWDNYVVCDYTNLTIQDILKLYKRTKK